MNVLYFQIYKIRFVRANTNLSDSCFVHLIMKIIPVPALLLLATILFLSTCTKNDAQRDFEREAYRLPQNYTQTSHTGAVISLDEDDWRTSPLFEGLVVVNPPFPNPVNTNENVQFELEVTGVQSVSGLEVIVQFDDADPSSGFKSLYFETQTLDPGLTTFRINPLELGRTDVAESARGLHRIYIFDGSQNMISYGDIQVQ